MIRDITQLLAFVIIYLGGFYFAVEHGQEHVDNEPYALSSVETKIGVLELKIELLENQKKRDYETITLLVENTIALKGLISTYQQTIAMDKTILAMTRVELAECYSQLSEGEKDERSTIEKGRTSEGRRETSN